MPIQITITAENAVEATQLVHDLAGAMSDMDPKDIPGKTEVSTLDKPNREELLSESKAQAKQIDIPDIVDLRKVAQEKGKTPEGKKAIKALLQQFGCQSISAVPKEKRAEFLDKLEAL